MSVRVVVGVHVHAEPARLLQTIEALEQHEILLLPDGPDAETRAALAKLKRLPQSQTAQALGPPACFNRLASTAADADVVILLESGAVPGPGAIGRLVDALEHEPGAGLAGPSTNSAWNEQCAFPRVARRRCRGRDDRARRGSQVPRIVETIGPLHNLADFCFAVRREVIDAIGGADEGYGLGPCWEMEYNARAARAGFDALWVCDAYVWRAPFTARRRRAERRLFEQSRRRYQDGLCGLRLRGARAGYEPHCRGDACEHFAPADLVQITRPLAERPAPAPAQAARDPARPRRAARQLHHADARPAPSSRCRRCGYFQRQDYPNARAARRRRRRRRTASRACPTIRASATSGRRAARASARSATAPAPPPAATFIAQWDDDDWYGAVAAVDAARSAARRPGRHHGARDAGLLRPPGVAVLERVAPGCTESCSSPTCTAERSCSRGACGRRLRGTRTSRSPRTRRSSQRARARGARLERLDGAGCFVYLRHERNAWKFACGSYLDRSGWREAAEPPLPPEDRAFYAARSPAAGAAAPSTPLVSCLMPTADRRRFVAQSIACFLRQDYPERELIVLDDGRDRVADLIPPDPRIRYVALDEKLVLGDKRNRACELARGEILVHWDDDDWHAPSRLSYQVGELERHGAAICGTGKILYFEPSTRRSWLYEYPTSRRPWISGLCYRKELWRGTRFTRVQAGEDTRFVWNPRIGSPLVLPDHRFFVGVVHDSNTSHKRTGGAYWHSHPVAEVRALLGGDFAFYEKEWS